VRGTTIKFQAGVPWLAIVCLLLAAFTSTWGGLRQLPMGQIADVFLALALLLILLMVVFGDLRFTIPFWIWIPPIAVILCLAIRWFDPVPYWQLVLRLHSRLPYAAQPQDSIKGGIWLIALIVVPIVIIGCTKIEPRIPQLVMGAFTAGVCVSSFVALTDLVGLTSIGSLPLNHGDPRRVVTLGTDGTIGRQVGLTSHPNMLGLTCVLAIPLALYFLYVLRHKWIPRAALVLLFGGVLATGSRGAQAAALLVCVLGVSVAPIWKAALRQTLIVLGVAAVAGVIMVHVFIGDVIDNILRFGGTSYATSEADRIREILIRQAVEDFANYPIAGIGMKSIINAHNIYLQLLQCGGVILTVAMLIYWMTILRFGWLLANRGHTAARYLTVSIGGWLILGMVSNQLTDRQLYYTVGCVAALASLYAAGNRDDRSTVKAPVSGSIKSRILVD
jgi:hypothetical protein